MFKWKRTAVAAVATVLALSGCAAGGAGDSGPSEGSGERGGTLTLATIAAPTSFSAQKGESSVKLHFMQAVYDTLLRFNPDGDLEPSLATEWNYSEDNTALTLKLRNDVTFVDGGKLTADAVKQNLLRFRDGTSPSASQLRDLKDVTVVDDSTVKLTLGAPNPALLTYLTESAGLVESPAAFTSPDIETVPVGSGPYKLNTGETVVGNSYVFEKNANYWRPEDQHYDKLVINVYSDPSALRNALSGGQLNASFLTDNTMIPQLEGTGFTISKGEPTWVGLLLADREGKLAPELADVRVRQAINHAFDRKALLDTLANGYGTVTGQVFPSSSPSFDESLDSRYDYNPEKAKKLLAEAGLAGGFTLKMPSTALVAPATYTLLAQQLADIGITVENTDLPVNAMVQDLMSQKYPATLFQLQQDPTDWQITQFELAAASPWNLFHVADPKAEELIGKIQRGDEAAGKELNKHVVEQAWFAPWYRPQSTFVSDASTKITPQPITGTPNLWNIVHK